ncbi:MAG: putative signal transducing protein [Actinomycetota bacterium]
MEDRVVQVFASPDTVAGEMMKGRLEAEGIQAMVKGDGEGPYRAGPVYLWVAADQADAARAVVEAVRSGAYELDESFAEPAEDPAGTGAVDETQA